MFSLTIRCAKASVATPSLLRCEPRQPLPQETVAVGQPLLLGEKLRGFHSPASSPAGLLPPSVRAARAS